MKAQEYADRLKKDHFNDNSMNWMINNFAKEIVDLKDKRSIKTDHGLIGVFRDQYQKWKAISRKTDGIIKPDGFFYMLEKISNIKVAEFARKNLKS